MKQAFERKLQVTFGFGLSILFLIGVVQCHTINKVVASNQVVAQAQETLEQLAAMRSLVADAAAGTRGYFASGDEGNLEPYRTATSEVPQTLQDLKRLTKENPRQQKNVAAIESLAAAELAELGKAVATGRQRGHSDLGLVSDVGTSPKMMEDLRQAINGMEKQERALLDRRNADARVAAREATLATEEGAAAGLWLLVIAGLVIRHYIQERRQSKSAGVISAQVLENMNGAVYLSDETGTILYANPAGEAMFGYKPGELVGENISRLSDFPVTRESGSLFDQIHERLTGCGTWRGDLTCHKRDDTLLKCHAWISALEAGGKVHWVTVLGDIPQTRSADDAGRVPTAIPIEEYARAS